MNAIIRPRRSYGIWIVLALLVVGGGFYWTKHAKKADAMTIDKAPVTRGNLTETISSTGTLSALNEVTVGSQVSGIVTRVNVDFNDRVKAGQVLAVIDPQTLQAQVNSAKAALMRAQTNYDEAVRQYKEGVPLFEQKYLSQRDLRTLEVAVQTTKTQLDAAQIDFDNKNVQLKYAEIRSPIDGVIMTRSVDPGNTVQASMQAPTLFVVASDLTKMKILANVDETQIAQIKEGMQARFTVSGIQNRVFNATVRQVRLKSGTTNNVVTYTVVLDADNRDSLLFPGMTATLDFVLSNLTDVLLVPSAALRVRIPDSLRVAEQPPANGGGMAPPANGQVPNAPEGMSGERGFRGPPNGNMNGPPTGRSGGMGGRTAVWMLNAEGKAYRVPVRVIGSDLTNSAVRPWREDSLKEGDEVLTRVVDPNSSSSRSSSSGGNMMGMPMGGGGLPGGGGMGPG